jgi:hypothetical protein
MAIQVTAQGVLSSRIVTPGNWYVVEVSKTERKPSKGDQSTNYIFYMEILADAKGDEEFAGCTLKPLYINEKGVFGSGINFLVACGLDKSQLPKKKGDAPFNVEQFVEGIEVGTRLKAFVITTEYEGRKGNEGNDFLPLT